MICSRAGVPPPQSLIRRQPAALALVRARLPLGYDLAIQPAPVRDAVQQGCPQPPGQVVARHHATAPPACRLTVRQLGLALNVTARLPQRPLITIGGLLHLRPEAVGQEQAEPAATNPMATLSAMPRATVCQVMP